MDEFLELAEAQYGLATRAQVIGEGVSRASLDKRIQRGRLIAVFPGVYRVPGAPVTDRQHALAACLWIGPSAAASHLSAASLLRLDRCASNLLNVSVPRDARHRARRGVVIHRVRSLDRIDRVVIDRIPCTSATRTLLDCAHLLNGEALEVAFESARRMGLTSVDALARRASELCGPGRSGSSAIAALLAHQRPRERAAQYRLEVKMARLFRQSDLSRPERQYPVGPYRIDFAFSRLMVGVEREGFDFHGSRLAWKRDKGRTAWLETKGWRLVFVTWDDVTRNPEQTLERIRIACSGAR